MKIFLDACAIIYWVELAQPQYDQFAHHLDLLRKKYNKPSFAASDLSLLECRVKPLREQNDALLQRYRNFFCANDLMMIPVTAAIIEEATHLRAFNQLRTPDAIQAASALSIAEGAVFISNDHGFKKVPKLKLVLI